MVSLAWKGLELEKRLGSAKFLVTLIILTLVSSIFYVVLAVAGADLLEDHSLMTQCAIGFSGVLFGMKVLNIHYSNQEQQRTSFFGFLVPMKFAVWLELIIIQVMVPNSSFMGHLAGILAGLVFVKGPLPTILSLHPPPHQNRRTSSSSSFISQIIPSNLITILLCILQTCLFLGLIPNLKPFTGCVNYLRIIDSNYINLPTVQTIFLSPLHHLSIIHLVINLISLYMKGRTLEPRLGSLRFLGTVSVSLVSSVITHLVLSLVTRQAYPDLSSTRACVSGLSSALFCLKIIMMKHINTLDTSLMFEMMELMMLLERNTRLYHVSGLVAGVIMLLWCQSLTDNVSWSSPGHTLGSAQPTWTRSWGYAGYVDDEDEEYQEALRRSHQTYQDEQFFNRSFTPSAPPAEHDDMVEDIVGVRPPLYAQEPAPPPPGQAFRMQSPASSSRSFTDEDLRRRRLERFS